MSTSPTNDYRDMAAMLTPIAVSQYLASQDWQLESRHNAVREIWRLPGDRGDLARIMLPLATDYADFTARFQDALLALAHVYDVDASQLAERIVSTRADLLFVRLDQPMSDGTIPFRQAETTIDALYKMLKAAATTADNPNHSHRGRRSDLVNEFLDNDVRLGHTKRGSFVFTILSRLGPAVPASGEPSTATGVDKTAPPRTFPRAAMQTLAQALETTRNLTRTLNDDTIEAAVEFGLSASLVESLEDIAAPPSLHTLDLSFQWAASEPEPAINTSSIVFDRAAINELPYVRERLVRRDEPARRETLVGPVRSLTRENIGPGEPETATIILIADVHGKTRAVNVTVTGDDHNWAILAYRRRLPFTVTGNLTREGRSWRLHDPVVDEQLLRHHLDERS